MNAHDQSGTPRARRAGRYRYQRPTAAELAARRAAEHRAREREARALASGRDPEVANILSRSKHQTVRSRRTREVDEGSLSRASAWTFLGSLLPGFGLIPTPRRRIGIVLLAVAGILGVAALAFLIFGNPVNTLLAFGLNSRFLLSALAVVVIGALVWTGVCLLYTSDAADDIALV